MVGAGKEYHTTWYFSLSRSPGNNLLRHFESKYDEYCTFLCECFLLCIKVSYLDPAGFFRNDFIYKYFLTKMKTVTMCFVINIFSNDMKDNVYGQDKSFLRNIVGCYQRVCSTNKLLSPIFSRYL